MVDPVKNFLYIGPTFFVDAVAPPPWDGNVDDRLKYAPPHVCYRAKFGRSRYGTVRYGIVEFNVPLDTV